MTESQINKFLDSLDKQNWEIKTLGEIATSIFRGQEISRSQLNTGTYPAVKCGDINSVFPQNFEDLVSFVDYDLIKNKQHFKKGDILFGSIAHSDEVIGTAKAYIGDQTPLAGLGVMVMTHNQNPKYLSFALSTKSYRLQVKKLSPKGTIFNLYPKDLKKIKIPLPPRRIQDTIADLLDQWTRLDTELTTELTTELNARLEQWGYYKNNLITKIKNAKIVTLGEIATSIFRGQEISRSQLNTGTYPAVKCGDINSVFPQNFEDLVSFVDYESIQNKQHFKKGDILFGSIAHSNEVIGTAKAYMGDQTPLAGLGVMVMKHNQNPKYLSFALSTKSYRSQVKKLSPKGTIFNLYPKDLMKIKIPLPSLEKQEEIVKILDLFNELCQSVKTGIPALIKSNKKQYEFLRDKIFEI